MAFISDECIDVIMVPESRISNLLPNETNYELLKCGNAWFR